MSGGYELFCAERDLDPNSYEAEFAWRDWIGEQEAECRDEAAAVDDRLGEFA